MVACTTIADKRNWNCDRVVIREQALLPEQEEEEAHYYDEFEDVEEADEGDEEGQDVQPSGGPLSASPPPPFTQS